MTYFQVLLVLSIISTIILFIIAPKPIRTLINRLFRLILLICLLFSWFIVIFNWKHVNKIMDNNHSSFSQAFADIIFSDIPADNLYNSISEDKDHTALISKQLIFDYNIFPKENGMCFSGFCRSTNLINNMHLNGLYLKLNFSDSNMLYELKDLLDSAAADTQKLSEILLVLEDGYLECNFCYNLLGSYISIISHINLKPKFQHSFQNIVDIILNLAHDIKAKIFFGKLHLGHVNITLNINSLTDLLQASNDINYIMNCNSKLNTIYHLYLFIKKYITIRPSGTLICCLLIFLITLIALIYILLKFLIETIKYSTLAISRVF